MPPVAAKAVEATNTVAAATEKGEGTAKKTDEMAKQTEVTAQKSMPGFENIFAIAGLLPVDFAVYRRFLKKENSGNQHSLYRPSGSVFARLCIPHADKYLRIFGF